MVIVSQSGDDGPSGPRLSSAAFERRLDTLCSNMQETLQSAGSFDEVETWDVIVDAATALSVALHDINPPADQARGLSMLQSAVDQEVEVAKAARNAVRNGDDAVDVLEREAASNEQFEAAEEELGISCS